MKKKSILKKLISPFWVSGAKKYLKKERMVHFFGLIIHVPTGVFHPTLFFSTKTLAQWLIGRELRNKNMMEIGCGSGAISVLCAKQGATVTCCDINSLSVKTTIQNAEKNKVKVQCMVSDIFDQIKIQSFDLILNNPPYYPKNPKTIEEHAWYAGDNYQYFKKLFHQSKQFLSKNGELILVLSDECNTNLINKIAAEEGFENNIIHQRSHFIEKTFIVQYKIQV